MPLFPPAGGRQPPNYLVPVHDVCSTLSQNFTPIAPSCVEISSTVQTNKKKQKQTKSKLNITPNATLWRDNNNHISTPVCWVSLRPCTVYSAQPHLLSQCWLALKVRARFSPVLVACHRFKDTYLCFPEILISGYALISLHEPTSRRALDLNPGHSQPDSHMANVHSPLRHQSRLPVMLFNN